MSCSRSWSLLSLYPLTACVSKEIVCFLIVCELHNVQACFSVHGSYLIKLYLPLLGWQSSVAGKQSEYPHFALIGQRQGKLCHRSAHLSFSFSQRCKAEGISLNNRALSTLKNTFTRHSLLRKTLVYDNPSVIIIHNVHVRRKLCCWRNYYGG